MTAVVVGVDGSDESMAALQLAAAEARLRRVPLRIVHAFSVPATATYTAGVVVDPSPSERAARRLVDSVLAAAGSELAGVEVETVVECGGGVPVLLDHTDRDDLLVVGSRGRGGFTGLLLGSVSQQVVLHAPSPVVVVRPGGRMSRAPSNTGEFRIVVGIDGSDRSAAALRWAIEEARLRDGEVIALCAWEFPHALNPVTMFTIEADPFRADAESALDRVIGAAEPGDVTVTRFVVEGAAAVCLVEVSADADLVVVGSRGRGGFRGLLLGSVSQQVTTQAHCPVVVHRECVEPRVTPRRGADGP